MSIRNATGNWNGVGNIDRDIDTGTLAAAAADRDVAASARDTGLESGKERSTGWDSKRYYSPGVTELRHGNEKDQSSSREQNTLAAAGTGPWERSGEEVEIDTCIAGRKK